MVCYRNKPNASNPVRYLAQLLIFLSLLVSPLAMARDYHVEVIVFERTNATTESEEQWIADGNQVTQYSEKLNSIARSASNISTTGRANILKRLESDLQSSGYRVLQSMRWRQPGRVFQNAPVIDLSNPLTGLRGYLKVYKTSLIFVDITLGLEQLTHDTTETDSSTRAIYFIDEKRRFKFKEVHYFDHPRFGAIVTVWP